MPTNEEVREQTAADADNDRKERLAQETGENDPDIARLLIAAKKDAETRRAQLEAQFETLQYEEEIKENIRDQNIQGQRVNEVPDREVGTDLAQPVPVAVDALIEDKLGEKDEEVIVSRQEQQAQENPEI